MFKRFLLIMLSAFLLISMFNFGTIAAGSVTITANYSDTSLFPGEEFDVALDLTGVSPVYGLAAVSLYLTVADLSKIEFVSITTTPSRPNEADWVCFWNAEIGKETVMWYDDSINTPILADLTLATVRFRVKSDATPGTTTITLTKTSVMDKDNTPVSATITAPAAKTITIEDPAPPAIPANVKAESTSYNSIKVSWDAVEGATGYAVYRSTSEAGTYEWYSTTSSTQYNNISLATGSMYYYKVRAFKTVNGIKKFGDFSPIVSAKPVPAIPANVKAESNSYNSIKVSWDAVTGATGYAVYRSMSNTGTYEWYSTTSSTNYINISLTTGSTYYYKVRAFTTVNGIKKFGDFSPVVSAKPTNTVPANVKAESNSYNSIKVSWDAVTGATGYAVYRSTSINGTYEWYSTTSLTNYINISLTTGSTYYYKVRSFTTVNGIKKFGDFSTVVSAKPVPAVPINVKAESNTYNSIKVSWDAVTGATGYAVYRSTSETGTFEWYSTTTSTNYININLATGSTYYYKVKAFKTVSGIKVFGNFSPVVSAIPTY